MAGATSKILTKDTHCGFCRGVMKEGEPFRWYLKSGVRGGSRARGTSDRYIPVHVDPNICHATNRAPTEAELQARQEREAKLDKILADFTAGVITAEKATELTLAAVSGR